MRKTLLSALDEIGSRTAIDFHFCPDPEEKAYTQDSLN